jgi:hypothetical protein
MASDQQLSRNANDPRELIEVMVKRESHRYFLQFHERKAGTIGKAENLVVVTFEDFDCPVAYRRIGGPD